MWIELEQVSVGWLELYLVSKWVDGVRAGWFPSGFRELEQVSCWVDRVRAAPLVSWSEKYDWFNIGWLELRLDSILVVRVRAGFHFGG